MGECDAHGEAARGHDALSSWQVISSELLCYVIMGFFPALVVLSMVSHLSALTPV